MKKVLAIISIPLSLTVIYLSMVLLWKFFGLPRGDELLVVIQNYLDRYGFIIVFISALIEGTFVVGQYYPGGTVIFLGVAATYGQPTQAIVVVLLVSIAFSLAYLINYVMGWYGWHRLLEHFGFRHSIESARLKLEKHKYKAIFSSYWEPNLASITAAAAGTLKLPFKPFALASVAAILGWNAFWGVIAYFTGNAITKLGPIFIFSILGVWIGFLVIKHFWTKRKFAKDF